jgi:hypothetical protein
MTDDFSDGWGGIVFGLTQNGVSVGTFGSGFVWGSSYGPITLSIPSQKLTKVVVAQYGDWTEECGFTIKYNGTILY